MAVERITCRSVGRSVVRTRAAVMSADKSKPQSRPRVSRAAFFPFRFQPNTAQSVWRAKTQCRATPLGGNSGGTSSGVSDSASISSLGGTSSTAAGGGGGGGSGNRGSGGGGGGNGGEEGEDSNDQQQYRPAVPLGVASLVALLLFFNKLIVCWCTDPSRRGTAAVAADMGFLTCLGVLGLIFALPNPAAIPFRPVLMEICVAHIFLEMLFELSGMRHPPTSKKQMGWDMWAHHFATAAIGVTALMTRNTTICYLGCRLIGVECTAALPIAFHESIEAKTFHGPRAVVLGMLMPIAFTARTLWAADVIRNVGLNSAAIPVPALRIIMLGGGLLVVLNTYWTYKVYAGVVKKINKARNRSSSSSTSSTTKSAQTQTQQQQQQQQDQEQHQQQHHSQSHQQQQQQTTSAPKVLSPASQA